MRLWRRWSCLLLVTCVSLFFLFDWLLPPSDRDGDGDGDEDAWDAGDAGVRGKGIRVVVGHFSPPLASLSADADAANESERVSPSFARSYSGFDPIPGEGEDGRPVLLPPSLQHKASLLRPINRFNLLVSDRISAHRRLPDARPDACLRRQQQDTDAVNASTAVVIVVAHNEALSTLARTLASCVSRASPPAHLLRQVILVDDASERTFMTDGRLERHLPPLVKLLRLDRRSGLVRARLAGVAAADPEADVLVFLDAHVECTRGWLAPLVAEVARGDRRSLVSPVIDVIHDETFAYARSFAHHVGGFNWGLAFRWFPPTSDTHRERDLVYPTPVMAGGLFAVDRRWFEALGAYDARMRVWGGENVELSLRAWLCGGRLLIHACSHVGHLFRSSSPYEFRDDATPANATDTVTATLFGNLARVVGVWTDAHAPFFRFVNPGIASALERQEETLGERRRLRARLSCHSFQWFLDHVWGDSHFFPTTDGAKRLVQVVSIGGRRKGLCVEQSKRPGRLLTLSPCSSSSHSPFPAQLFVWDKRRGSLASDEGVCADATGVSRHLFMNACDPTLFSRNGTHRRQQFAVRKRNLVHVASRTCVTPVSRQLLTLSPCREGDVSQHFALLPVDWRSPSH